MAARLPPSARILADRDPWDTAVRPIAAGRIDFNLASGPLPQGSDTTLVTVDNECTFTASGSVAINVNEMNGPPVNTVPGAKTVNEDAVLSLGGQVSVADPDSSALTTTLIKQNVRVPKRIP